MGQRRREAIYEPCFDLKVIHTKLGPQKTYTMGYGFFERIEKLMRREALRLSAKMRCLPISKRPCGWFPTSTMSKR